VEKIELLPDLIISDESSRAVGCPEVPAVLHEASVLLWTDGRRVKSVGGWRLRTLLSNIRVLSHTATIQLMHHSH